MKVSGPIVDEDIDAAVNRHQVRTSCPFTPNPLQRYSRRHLELLEAVMAAFVPGEVWLWSSQVLERLHGDQRLDMLDAVTPQALGTTLSRIGLKPQQVSRRVEGRVVNRRAIIKTELKRAINYLVARGVSSIEDTPQAARSSIGIDETIPAIEPVSNVDLAMLAVGCRIDGLPWHVDLTGGRHHLLAGATGSGKSSVMHSIIRALAPAIHEGWVRLKGIDPKFGAELLPVRGLLEELMVFNGSNMPEVAGYMTSLIDEMQQSAGLLASQGIRKHTPTPEHPFTLVLIDEVAQMTSYLGTTKTREQINGAIAALCTMGRAAGWGVLAALQDPRKDVLFIRNLFTVKVALRLEEKVQVNMVLGDGARARGAECDKIAKDRPGLAYVREDGDPDPVLVRAAFVSDQDIADVSQRYRAPRAPRVLGLPKGFPLVDVTVVAS